MKTADSIEASEARKDQTSDPVKYPKGKHPNSHPTGKRRLSYPTTGQWKPGQSGNPSGRPKDDVARKIAKAVFENNTEALYKAFARAALKGNAYAFTQLADRAYGKMKETTVHEIGSGGAYPGMSTEQLDERIRELEAQLGIVRQIENSGSPGGVSVDTIRALPPSSSTED